MSLLTLTCLFLSSMILVICIFFRPMAASFLVSLTPRQYQKNNTIFSPTLLAHCAAVTLLVYASFFFLHNTLFDRPHHNLQEDKHRKTEKQGRGGQKVNLTLNNVSSGTSKHQRTLFSVLKHIQKVSDPHGINLFPLLLHLSCS